MKQLGYTAAFWVVAIVIVDSVALHPGGANLKKHCLLHTNPCRVFLVLVALLRQSNPLAHSFLVPCSYVTFAISVFPISKFRFLVGFFSRYKGQMLYRVLVPNLGCLLW